MKVAVIADIHLPGKRTTVKEDIFKWALAEAKVRKADLIAGAGDLTSMGEISAAERIMAQLESCGLPFILAPGNAEFRSKAETERVLQIMQTANQFDNVVCVDSAHGNLTEESSAFLRECAASGKKGLLLISHCPVSSWEDADRDILNEMISNGTVTMVVYGHKHIDISGFAMECVRGLDPDKASGGAPALVFFTQNADNSWLREDVVCPLAEAKSFPEEIRKEIYDSFGISGMKTPLESLSFAIEKNLPVFEIRFSSAEDFLSPELQEAVGKWRKSGGRYLSLHMPDLRFNGENFTGMEAIEAASSAAVKLGCNGVTFHVPRCFADELDTPEKICRAAAVAAENMKLLFENNISVGVENLHTDDAERIAKRYKFGCTGVECMAFINALRNLYPDKKIGLHLDIGHARNNMPFSSRETLSDWYADYGKEIVAMHIHQVNRTAEPWKNHTGFDHFYGMLISLSSLVMARRSGQIGKVPMILELRCSADETLAVLQKELLG